MSIEERLKEIKELNRRTKQPPAVALEVPEPKMIREIEYATKENAAHSRAMIEAIQAQTNELKIQTDALRAQASQAEMSAAEARREAERSEQRAVLANRIAIASLVVAILSAIFTLVR